MVICPECQTKNSVDSQFCKACGVAIPRDASSEAQAKLDALVSEGYAALHDGRTEEAFLIAQNVLEEAPENIRALSLKGMALERHGKIPEALETFEKVVALNPDSALDKIKVQQLRNALTAQTLQAPAPNKGRAGLAAAAATLLVISIGVAGAIYANQSSTASTPEVAKNLTETNPGATAFNNAGATNLNFSNPAGTQQTPQNPQGNQPAAGTGGQQPTQGGIRDLPGRPQPSGGRTLPDVNGGGLEGQIAPVQPSGLQINPQPSNPPQQNQNPPREEIDPSVDGGNRGNTNAQPRENPGMIDIQVSRPNPTNGGSREADPQSGNGLEALMRTAREQYMLGKFADAARTYERALAAGGDSAMVNQRLGQCYKNLGRNSDAIQAFKRAQAAIESRMSRGGDTSRLQAQLEAVKQELKLLQG